ncbi:MaoC/PaaZ C-terminal domain-containing protein [Gordonia paraffinivorans]|uniref:MaoC/PaaZ C-terminal domain-containing protein n=1 Tax=Gordonia paraffinivorans TaxID=175628 RepID=UPI0021B23B19|nr:MaoC/PaaZ C-terminal domain-containing protein [Gordonia paraffinivorans]
MEIHTDPVRAAGTAHGSTIAHGFLTLSLLAPFLEDLLEVQDVHTSVNYGLNRVRFPAPVPANSTVHCTGTIASIDEIGTATQVVAELTVHSDTSLKPVCVAEIILRLLR